MSRRSFLRKLLGMSGLSAWMAMPPIAKASPPTDRLIDGPCRRIAVEEAFATVDLFEEWDQLLAKETHKEPGFQSLYGPFFKSPVTKGIRHKLLDVGKGRIQEMDRYDVDMQILSITAPGVQIFSDQKAVELACKINDQLAMLVADYPNRYAGLATIAPQVPEQAALELERAVQTLGMKGAIINSHTQGEYLDDPKYWSLFDAAQSLDVPIYLHPRTPSPSMLSPFLAYGLEGAGWGFAAETSLHAMRLILSGVFDRFPNLNVVLGHMGEGIPFWLSRIDSHFSKRTWTQGMDSDFTQVKQLKKQPSQYFKENFFITTSGMNWSPALMFAISVLGADRILFAIDYPYESISKAVEGFENTAISANDKKKIYHLNAIKLFNL